MQVRCVRPFGRHEVGDLAEVPDGASVDPEHYEVVGQPPPADPPPTDPAPAAPSASLFAPKEGM